MSAIKLSVTDKHPVFDRIENIVEPQNTLHIQYIMGGSVNPLECRRTHTTSSNKLDPSYICRMDRVKIFEGL